MTLSTVQEVADEVAARYPMITSGLLPNWCEVDDPEWVAAEQALEYLRTVRGADGMTAAVEAFAMTCVEFMRLQARFRHTGRYARASAQELIEELYGDDEEMSGYYLDGLLMTYVLWPNHARMLVFLAEEFIPLLPTGARLLEIGPGHGLLGHRVVSAVDQADYTALDISASSLRYVEAAFHRAPVGPVTLLEGDACRLDDDRLPVDVDGLICCEVLEHVDDPMRILRAIYDRLALGGHALVSTVANLEAIDHVYLYDDEHHIRSHFSDAGLEIVAENFASPPGDQSEERIPLNYVAVVRRS